MPNAYTAGKPTQFQYLLEALKIETDECQVWPFTKDAEGYGQVWYMGTNTNAHRTAKRISDPNFNPSLDVLHSCDNPPCFNPRHLFQGTQADNGADMVKKGRSAKGEQQWCAKLTAAKVREIRNLRYSGLTQTEIGKMFGVSQSAVTAIYNRGYWKHVK